MTPTNPQPSPEIERVSKRDRRKPVTKRREQLARFIMENEAWMAGHPCDARGWHGREWAVKEAWEELKRLQKWGEAGKFNTKASQRARSARV